MMTDIGNWEAGNYNDDDYCDGDDDYLELLIVVALTTGCLYCWLSSLDKNHRRVEVSW